MAAPILAARITHFPLGVTSYGFPLVGKTTGRVFFVDSTNNNKGDDLNHGDAPQTPFGTIAYAASQANLGSNRGDVIYVLPGHIETITSLGAITMSVAGVAIVGIGIGRNRPTVTLSSNVAAAIVISAANCQWENIVVDMTGVDQIGQGGAGAAGIRVGAADFTLLNNEIIIATPANQVKNAIGITTGANRCRIINNLIAGTPDAGPDSAIQIYGAGSLALEGIEIIGNRVYGDFAVAGLDVNLTDTLRNIFISENIITAAGSAQVALSIQNIAGDSSGVVSKNTMLGTNISSLYDAGGTGIANVDNKGFDIDTLGVEGVPIPVIGTSLPVDTSLIDQILGEFSAHHANYLPVTVDLSDVAWNTVAKHTVLDITGLCRVIVIPECAIALTSGGGATMTLGYTGAPAAAIAATTATDIDANEIWLTTTPGQGFTRAQVIDLILQGTACELGFEIAVAAMTGGSMVFHCWWVPLNQAGAVVAGTGGVF